MTNDAFVVVWNERLIEHGIVGRAILLKPPSTILYDQGVIGVLLFDAERIFNN